MFFVHSKHVISNAGQKNVKTKAWHWQMSARRKSLGRELWLVELGRLRSSFCYLSRCEKTIHAWKSIPMVFLCMRSHRAGGI